MFPRRFALVRHVDYTGVSGVGVVAYGVVFGGGQVALRWSSTNPSVSVWDSLDDVIAVHGHGQATSVEWIDDAHDDTTLVEAVHRHHAPVTGRDTTGSTPPQEQEPASSEPPTSSEPSPLRPEPVEPEPIPPPEPIPQPGPQPQPEPSPGPAPRPEPPSRPDPPAEPEPVSQPEPPPQPEPMPQAEKSPPSESVPRPEPLVPNQSAGPNRAFRSYFDETKTPNGSDRVGRWDAEPEPAPPRQPRRPGRHRRREQPDSGPLRLVWDEPR